MSTTIDIDETNPDLMPVKHETQTSPEPIDSSKPAITSAQAKIDAVAALTMKAYERASLLQLTDSEIEALAVDFPDEAFLPGAAGKENLIYCQHSYLRDRLNKVFRPGQWSIIPRNRWAEDFTTQGGKPASRVYVEAMLVIRGCFVAEAVGEMEYYPNNASQNYGDAVEGAKTAALRRCCKELGIGLQAWKKEWCDGWWQRKRGQNSPAKPPQTAQKPQERPVTAQQAQNVPETLPIATVEQRNKMIKMFESEGQNAVQRALGYFIEAGIILPNEPITAVPLDYVPTMASHMRELGVLIAQCNDEGKAVKPSWVKRVEVVDPKKPIEMPREASLPLTDEPWRTFPMPFGKNAGKVLAELPKNYLYGLWANYEVEEEYNGKPKKPETIAKDEEFREMLDAAGEHYKFEEKA